MAPEDPAAKILSETAVPVWPTAGKALGISRNSAYSAVRRKEIPSIRIGNALRVPTTYLRAVLGLESKAA